MEICLACEFRVMTYVLIHEHSYCSKLNAILTIFIIFCTRFVIIHVYLNQDKLYLGLCGLSVVQIQHIRLVAW